MLLTKIVEQKWNSKTKKHYVDLGYKFTAMKDSFMVAVEHLTHASFVIVDVKCDYCGKEYQKRWCNYLLENEKSTIHKDCCINCRKLKIVETSFEKYGVSSVLKLDDVKQKVAETNLSRYGVENPFQSEFVKEKICNTNLVKYGVTSPLKNKEILNKVKKTCLDKYGVDYYVRLQHFIREENPRWKGGVAYHRVERSTYDYILWRKEVFAKDKYTCKCCGSKNGNGTTVKLHDHHIRNWKNYPESRYDVSNGATLCEDCHILFHRIFGKANNDEFQFNDFINNYDKKIC